ncbi:hypothetical protein BYT27DRAFT_7146988 [Phlegmacium glaucopus]|nr:hypothetical protein BYT27DRAFT_7146988 [Phlegmacium glaucopus]
MLNFSLTSPNPTRYGPRTGNIILKRSEDSHLQIPTPNLLTTTSRGVVPHLSRDHYKITNPILWVNVPFETFLEHNPPVPTLQTGHNPLHRFLGFNPNNHLLSMSARDPHDGREMPPNGQGHTSVYTLRGVRKLSPKDWRSYILACQPDIVFSLSDIPFTDPPYSQKRITKTIERSSAWLSNLLHPNPERDSPLNILVHMAGGTSIPARKAFAENLLETLHGPEAEAVKPLEKLDDGVVGYSFDLVPLRQSLDAQYQKPNTSTPSHTDLLLPLLESSLAVLPMTKLRLINSTKSPHEILQLVSTIGIDLFDAQWAQQAADIGIALDFQFPVCGTEIRRTEIGHNLYDSKFSLDFNPLANTFRGVCTADVDLPVCLCAACSPKSPPTRISHGADTLSNDEFKSKSQYKPPFTPAYIHHLLHTHEMSAHALLVMHNLEVLSSFFAGIRQVLVSSSSEKWMKEVDRFMEMYDESLGVFEAAKLSWTEVDLARGRGRLVRERMMQEEIALAMDADAE